jgi:tRNA A-37 threonylcarbamoyl transferase component Bud32
MTVPRPNHPNPAELAAFAVGKLSVADADAVAAHLEACPDCRRAAEDAPGDSFVERVRDARPTPPPSGGTRSPAPVALPPDLPPELASHPRYRILRELGRGGMGVVYQARQTVMDRQVVIKVINKSLLDNPDALERFRREVRAAAKLAHPNIVTAYDAEQAGDLHMLVMEFVPGQSLAEVLQQKGPLPVALACDCARQAALGLQHAFEQGMVHRDIKPQNLMRTPQGQVKILDFGLAKVASERGSGTGLTSSGAYMGTPDYSAPEQATDARKADIRADLYSLGCTLYCLLAGRPPFREETPVLTILAHLEKAPRPLPELRPDVPAGLWAVVARLLAKDPARRYSTPAEVAQALAPFCKAEAKAGRLPASDPPPPTSPKRANLVPQHTTRPAGLSQGAARPAPVGANTAPAEPLLAELVTAAIPRHRGPAERGDRRWWLAGVTAAVVAALGLGVCPLGALLFWAAHPPAGTEVPGLGEFAKERRVADFTSVEVDTAIQLEVAIRQGDTFHVAVTAEDNLLPRIRTTRDGSALRIVVEPGHGPTPADTPKVAVTMPALEAVRLGGPSRATLDGFRPAKGFRARLAGPSSLEGEIRADTVDIDASGMARANLRGSGKNVTLKAGDSSQLHLDDFAADNAAIDLSAASMAWVQVKTHLDYNLSGASQLHYRGGPAIGNRATSDAATASRAP